MPSVYIPASALGTTDTAVNIAQSCVFSPHASSSVTTGNGSAVSGHTSSPLELKGLRAFHLHQNLPSVTTFAVSVPHPSAEVTLSLMEVFQLQGFLPRFWIWIAGWQLLCSHSGALYPGDQEALLRCSLSAAEQMGKPPPPRGF